MPLYKRVPQFKSLAQGAHLDGKNVRVEYADNGEQFKHAYPMEGEILTGYEDREGPGAWFLVWLDNSFDLDGETHAHVLIAARYAGRPIGGMDPAPVYVKLPDNIERVQGGTLDIEKMVDLGWGVATII